MFTTIVCFLVIAALGAAWLAAHGTLPFPKRQQSMQYRRMMSTRRLDAMPLLLLQDVRGTLTDTRLTAQKSPILGSDEYFGLAANTVIQKGQMVGQDVNGNLVPANNAACVRVLGAANHAVDNSTPPSGSAVNTYGLTGVAGQGSLKVDYGENCWANDTVAPVTAAMNGLPCFAKDDQTVSASDGDGAYLPAGVICGVGDEKGGGDGQVHVQQGPVGVAVATSLYEAGSGAGIGYGGDVVHRVRGVITSMPTYTAAAGVVTVTATASNPTVDGISFAVGDILHLQASQAATASDEGPYIVTAKAATGTHFVMSRPTWWETASTQYDGTVLELGSEGTAYGGSTWKAMPAVKSFVVDTTAPDFYPRLQHGTVAAMTAGVSPSLATLYVSTIANVTAEPLVPGGTAGPLRVSTQTAGLPTASSLIATSSSTSDTATVKFKVTNF